MINEIDPVEEIIDVEVEDSTEEELYWVSNIDKSFERSERIVFLSKEGDNTQAAFTFSIKDTTPVLLHTEALEQLKSMDLSLNFDVFDGYELGHNFYLGKNNDGWDDYKNMILKRTHIEDEATLESFYLHRFVHLFSFSNPTSKHTHDLVFDRLYGSILLLNNLCFIKQKYISIQPDSLQIPCIEVAQLSPNGFYGNNSIYNLGFEDSKAANVTPLSFGNTIDFGDVNAIKDAFRNAKAYTIMNYKERPDSETFTTTNMDNINGERAFVNKKLTPLIVIELGVIGSMYKDPTKAILNMNPALVVPARNRGLSISRAITSVDDEGVPSCKIDLTKEKLTLIIKM